MSKKSATKRRDGRYMAYAVLSSGRKAVYGASEDEAVEKAVQLEEEERDYLEHVKFTFSNVYENWFLLKLKEVKPQTADRLEVVYNKYFKDKPISSMDMRSLTNLFCINWFLDLLNVCPMKYKEFQRILQLFVGVYDFAVDCFGMDDVVNWERVKKNVPRSKFIVTEKKEYAVSDNTISSISTAVKEDIFSFSKPSAVALLYCNFFMGLRIGELASLKWSDIDFNNKILSVHATETKAHERDSNGKRTGRMVYNREAETKTLASKRTFPLVQEALDILSLIKRYHIVSGYTSEYVAFDGVENASMVRSLDRTLRKLYKDLELPSFNSHLIRKTVATKLHNGGIATREVADLLGHTDMTTTERNYIISIEKNLDGMRKKLEEVL